jgi:hypothetical protein
MKIELHRKEAACGGKFNNMRAYPLLSVAALIICLAALLGGNGCAVNPASMVGLTPTSTMRMSNVFPLSVPDGAALPVARRANRLNLTLTVMPPSGTYYERYGTDMGKAAASGFTGMADNAYRHFGATDLTRELAEYLSVSGIFKRVEEKKESYEEVESDLVLTMELTKFELRENSTTEMFISVIGFDRNKVTHTTEAELEAKVKLSTREGIVLFQLPISQKSAPETEVASESILGNQDKLRSVDERQAERRARLQKYNSLVQAMFERVHAKLVAMDKELLAMSGPELLVSGKTPLGPVKHRYAVIVGLSRYKFASPIMRNLKYADRDAKSLAEFFLSPAGGGFQPDGVRLLVNEDATYKNIRAALFEFLRDASKDDFVVIYFSGHGVPDPRNPSQLYLACYDTDPAHLPSTGLPMSDVREALEKHIESQRTLVLADACHSAGVSKEGTRGVGRGVSVINTSFARLTDARPTCAVFTSSEGYELSQEGEQWGGGHGVFTWGLLEAFKGKAGAKTGDAITLGEVMEFARDFVIKETNKTQHPYISGVFDRNLPLVFRK